MALCGGEGVEHLNLGISALSNKRSLNVIQKRHSLRSVAPNFVTKDYTTALFSAGHSSTELRF